MRRGAAYESSGCHRAKTVERRARGAHPLEEMGPLPERAAVGHGPRGLQRRRQRLGLLHPRPGALASLPVGRGRARRPLRRQAAAVLRAGVVERARSDPEGAPVRTHQQRGEPRRGRQGVLLLHRQHAHPLVHEVSLQVPAAGVSLPGPDRDQPRDDRAKSSSTSCSIPASSTQDRYFDVFVEYAKDGPEDILVRITVHNRGPEAARLRVLPTLWFRNTWSWGEASRSRRCAKRRLASFRPRTSELGEYWLHCDGAPELLFTENESNAGRLWGQPNASPYVKDAFHEYVISGRGEAVNPAKIGTKAAAHYVLDVPGGGSQIVRLRLSAARASQRLSRFRRHRQEPDRRRGRILRSDYAGLAERRRTARAPPGAGGHALEQAVLPLRSGSMAAGAPRPSAARIPPARRAEHGMVSHAERRRDLHAGQVGVSLVRGVGPGLPHARPGAGGFRFRQGTAPADAAQSLRPPQRADSRLRVELQRRESAGARLGHAVPLQNGADARPRRPPFPGAVVSGVDAEFQLVGQPQGSRRGATCSPAAFWVSTTSASSTAAHRSRPAARWSRRTAPPGWRSTASACWRWP